ncbi:MAG TPA: FkbM family methyltransferase [Flavisolibacter sp.]|nr:FkbM family methyltransferase [Flavisolibacter sp.]
MNRSDKIKLLLTRNWKFPGRERLSRLLKPSMAFKYSSQNCITWLNDEPLAIYTSPDSYIEWTILSTGTYEPEIEKLIALSLKEGDVALDIGANIGLQSLRMARCVGNSGQVLAFEPLTHLQQKLKQNTLLNRLGNIRILPYALSDRENELSYSINENAWNQGAFSLGQVQTGNTEQSIQIKKGDLLPEIQQLPKLDLIKIDVEGFEFPVLKGLQQTLEKFKPRLIFEYDQNYWRNCQQDIDYCYQFLQELNYTIYQIIPLGCHLLTRSDYIESGNLYCICTDI